MRAALAAGLLLVVALAAAGPAPADAREQSARCHPRSAKGVAASTRVRVFRVERAEDDYVIYACDLLTGRRTRIATGDRASRDDLFHVRFAGRHVGFVRHACEGPLSGPVACTSSVNTLDVKTRRLRSSGELERAAGNLVLSPSGLAAWVETGDPPVPERVVRRFTQEGTVEDLHDGAVHAGSLALSRDGRLYWRNGPLTHTFPLDPPEPADGREPTAPSHPTYSDPEPRGSRRCFPSRSVTVAASTRIRVYRRTARRESEFDDDLFTYAACDLRTGRRFALGSEQPPDTGFGIRVFAFVGARGTVGVRECAKYAAECWGTIHPLDMGGAQRPTVIRAREIFDLLMAPSGSVAWINGATAPIRSTGVHRCDASGCTVLDTGSDLGWTSLARSEASDLYWMKGDEPRTATLD